MLTSRLRPLVRADENAIRAQLEIKAGRDAKGARDTRSIIRRAHNARRKSQQAASITVQLYLSVRKVCTSSLTPTGSYWLLLTRTDSY